MPSVAETPLSISPGNKKRRREDASFSCGNDSQANQSSPRNSYHDTLMSMEMDFIRNDARRLLSPKRKLHDSKRQRVSTSFLNVDRLNPFQSSVIAQNAPDPAVDWPRPPLPQSTSLPNIHSENLDFSIRKSAIGKVDLSACHICRRKPTLKRELEDFLDCENCGERTCAVCVRECLGFGSADEERSEDRIDHDGDYGQIVVEKAVLQGHRGLVCSRCCVERGTEGEVWCLGCLGSEQKGRDA